MKKTTRIIKEYSLSYENFIAINDYHIAQLQVNEVWTQDNPL